MQEVGDDDVDVGVFGAEPFLELEGENAVPFWSLFPSDKTVNFGEVGDGVLGGLTKVVILNNSIFSYVSQKSQTS